MTDAWDVRSEAGLMSCYRATLDAVYRYASMLCGHDRAAAEDLVSDVYLAMMRAAAKGTVSHVSVGYLTTAARHRFLDRLRSAQREERRLRLVASAPDDHAGGLGTPTLLADLPERERTVLVLRYVDDLPMTEAAEVLGLSVSAAESLAARAIRRLRRQEVRDA